MACRRTIGWRCPGTLNGVQENYRMVVSRCSYWHAGVFPTRLHVHERMNADGTSTKWFIFLKQWYNEYNANEGIYTLHFLSAMHAHSVHNRFLKPWWGLLLCFFPSCHVFLPPLSKLNWRSLTPTGGPVPPPPKWRPLPQGPHTLPFPGPEQGEL